LEAELTRLLASGGLGNALQSGGAWYSLGTTSIDQASDASPARLGAQIAGAVYERTSK
jgi:hypothetical protein